MLEARVRDLEARLFRLEGTKAQVAEPVADLCMDNAAAVGEDCVPQRSDRRQMLRHVGSLAAGTIAAGTVLAVAQTQPAGAVTVSGSGNPGIEGLGTGGDGVVGTTDTWPNSGVHGSTTVGQAGVRGQNSATDGRGVVGSADGWQGIGVLGESSYIGVRGTTTGTGTGVGGHSPQGSAVHGSSNSGTGVVGLSTIGTGGAFYGAAEALFAQGERGLRVSGSVAQIHLDNDNLPPPTTAAAAGVFHAAGDIILDINHALWLCVVSGDPGTWRCLGGPASAGSFHVLPSTFRIYDSRDGQVPLSVTKGRFVDHLERPIAAGLAPSLPAGATAAMVNITATNTNPGGYFALFPAGTVWPGNSSLNWGEANTTVASTTVVGLSTGLDFIARCEGAGGADLVVDLIGYYL